MPEEEDAHGLESLVCRHGRIRNRLPVEKFCRGDTTFLKGRGMDEDVLAASFRLYETVALRGVEPLDGAGMCLGIP